MATSSTRLCSTEAQGEFGRAGTVALLAIDRIGSSTVGKERYGEYLEGDAAPLQRELPPIVPAQADGLLFHL